MGLQIRQKLSSLGPIFADRRPKSDRLLVRPRRLDEKQDTFTDRPGLLNEATP